MQHRRRRRRIVLGERRPEPEPTPEPEEQPVGARSPGVRERRHRQPSEPDLNQRIRGRIEAARPFSSGGTFWRPGER
jgi:hypothetical protein